jgi:uncharacterized protein (TIGR02600 family)
MNASQFSSTDNRRKKAIALVMVITVVALMSILMVAIFSVTRMEYKSTQAYVVGKSAKQLGDIATAIVQAQIQNAQNTLTTASRTTHATQPGLVRVYDANGSFNAAYKLYSSSTMKVVGAENSLYSDQNVPPSNWNTLPARFVDLNEPVVRPGLVNGTYAVYFPILDPRAAWNYGNGGQGSAVAGSTQVEGFSYSKTAPAAATGGNQDYSAMVITPTDTGSPDNLRLPMPVEWLYMLEDGSVGAVDASGKFVSSSATTASADNPIVGRVAFWTDDESCKINVNTASEPTFVSSPFYFHQRDSKWAQFPPVTGEYQRYPGHPATVALSAVLAPNYQFDPLLPQQDGLSSALDVVNLKEQIYKFSPKISAGGSEEGTRPFAQDDFSSQNGERSSSVAIDLTTTAKERLFASEDEMLFQDLLFSSSTGRSQATISLPNGKNFFDHDILERSRFFLTAQSRSPEFNIHGLPRVCIWPVADENARGPKWRTSFDNMIAFCSTIQKNASSTDTYSRSYIFRRANASNGSSDLNISRNTSLLDYLVNQMSQLTWPATSYSSINSSANFQSKYGQDNVNQLAIQFFDYIRCTNLYDGITSRNNDASGAYVANPPNTYLYIKSLYDYNQSYGAATNSCYTFTSQRMSPKPSSLNVSGDAASSNQAAASAQGGILPGHGQVSPAVWAKGGRSYKGFGRMITLSEIGFQFICTGDGQTDTGSVPLAKFPKAAKFGLGGGTAWHYSETPVYNNPPVILPVAGVTFYQNPMGITGNAAWYSNFPPLMHPADIPIAMTNYGCQISKLFPLQHPSKHPGFYGQNWNMTLANNTPLQPEEKRIQVMLLLEAFCPSLGYTGLYPEYTIVLDGSTIAQMKMTASDGSSQALFSTTGDIPIKSYTNIYSAGRSADILGGHASPSSIAGGRQTRQIQNGGGIIFLPADPNYDQGNPQGHKALQNYAFCSDFITVKRAGMLNVTFPSADIKVSIYDTHNWETASPVQVLNVNFGGLSPQVPMPNLANSHAYFETVDSYGRTVYTRTRQGPHYWVANYEGCLGIAIGTPNTQYDGTAKYPFWVKGQEPTVPQTRANNNYTQTLRGRLDTASLVVVDQRQNVSANGISVIAPNNTNKDSLPYTDVVRSIIPAMGDYRTLAARYGSLNSPVPSTWWKPHPFSGYINVNQAHSFTSSVANSEPGCKLAQSNKDDGTPAFESSLQLIGGARFDLNSSGSPFNPQILHPRQADLPPDPDYASAANAFGDFDTGVSNAREGPYINKPDEGNFYAGNETLNGQTKFFRSAYFFNTFHNADDWRSGIYMTPNRMISSPVMFGSLPTGVWGNPGGLPTGSSANADFAPWQTLLFRPHTQITNQTPPSQVSHPGMQDPCDHYLLDLFFMPVVEPYSISEPLSIAGRVNMNYQIMPFTNIRRATGMHAVMKGEFMTAIPNIQIVAAKEYYPAASGTAVWNQRFSDDASDNRYWHRPIDVAATLRQFDLKFSHKSGGQDAYQGLFRSASQICEMHLIPKITGGNGGTIDPDPVANATNQGQINGIMNKFWSNNRPTGDNVRERPYSNLYARLTTRSNTFRVHVRAQVIKKARSTDPTIYDPSKDTVLSEYRGSTLLERYIDPTDTTVTIPDYAQGGINQAPLDTFYRFHSLETKRFNP